MTTNKIRFDLALFIILILGLVCQSSAFGHFVWVAKTDDGGQVRIYFGEGPHPDKAQFLGGLKEIKVWSVDANGNAKPLAYEKKTEGENGWFEAKAGSSIRAVDVDCQYGLFSRGEKSMLLHYCAKYSDYQPGMKTNANPKLPVDVICQCGDQMTTFNVLHNQKPVVESEVQIVEQGGQVHDLKTDSQGMVKLDKVPNGQWLVRAKVTEPKAGTFDGKEYSEKRTYCTLVIGLQKTQVKNSEQADSESTKSTESAEGISQPFASKLKTGKSLPELPVGITSFGGAVVGDHVYAFGGHCGHAHEYYKGAQNSKLYRLNWNSPTDWEVVHEGSSGLQGLAMVQHQGNLYRVGGFVARNEEGEDQDLHSVGEFARFNSDKNAWEQLSPMPVPRSSLDAVVVGDKLFVVGGWTLAGKDSTVWCDDAVWIDLKDKDAKWQKLDVPFKRRALSVGFQGDKLYVIGGMREKGGPTGEVSVYDIANNKWSDGPKLPGEKGMEGFGNSCFNVGGKLVLSTYSGQVLRLNDGKAGWEKLHELETGRFFHRLLPLNKNKFVLVGGANMDVGKLHDVEVFEF